MAPVQLHPLAPRMEGLVARLPVRLPECLARLAVGAAQPLDEMVELDLSGGFSGEEFLRLSQPQQRLLATFRAGAATEAVAVRNELTQPLGCTRRHGSKPPLQSAQGLPHYIEVARSGQQLANARQPLSLAPVHVFVNPSLP